MFEIGFLLFCLLEFEKRGLVQKLKLYINEEKNLFESNTAERFYHLPISHHFNLCIRELIL